MTPVLVHSTSEVDHGQRQTLILATERLLVSGTMPTLAEAAHAAGLGLDAAERLFPGLVPLLLEAGLLQGLPEVDDVFRDAFVDPEGAAVGDRVERVALLLHRHLVARARVLPFFVLGRLVELALQSADVTGSVADVPLIDAAIRPLVAALPAVTISQLSHTLTLMILAQSLIAARTANELQRRRSLGDLGWACRTLVKGAMAQPTVAG